MQETAILRLSGLFALLSTATLVATIGTGLALGGSGPTAIDFGDPDTLTTLSRGGDAGIAVVRLALIAPTLGLGAGIGWLVLAGWRNGTAIFGVLAWYIGTLLIVAQDAIELAALYSLPRTVIGAAPAALDGVLAAGAVITEIIGILTLVGTLVSDFGLALVAGVLVRSGGSLRWLGLAGICAAIFRVSGVLVTSLEPLRLLGFLFLLGWLAGTGVVMSRRGWRRVPHKR